MFFRACLTEVDTLYLGSPIVGQEVDLQKFLELVKDAYIEVSKAQQEIKFEFTICNFINCL